MHSETLVGVSKTVKTHVSGGGGGGNYQRTEPIWVRTAHQTEIDLFIKNYQGDEHTFRIHYDIPLREGHLISLVTAHAGGERPERYCVLVNHTTGKTYFMDSSNDTIQPSPPEWLALSGFSFLILCILLGLASGELGFWIGVVVFGALGGGIFLRWKYLQERFAEHCVRVGKLLQ